MLGAEGDDGEANLTMEIVIMEAMKAADSLIHSLMRSLVAGGVE